MFFRKRSTTDLITIDETSRYQTWEVFGASSGWWSQVVGGWGSKIEGEEIRSCIATLLHDEKDGIGFNEYRYNLGAEVKFHNAECHSWRAAECFLTEDGTYDFNRDENARRQLSLSLAHGVKSVVLFCCSAPDVFTKNGKTYGNKGCSNLPECNYVAFSDFCLDVAEHFLDEGVPVTSISPVNEPQWKWDSPKQEGCHFETEELIAFYRVFLERLNNRPKLKNVKLALPEGGEWSKKTLEYVDGLMQYEEFRTHVECLDVHSYWASLSDRKKFYRHIQENYPKLKLKNTEVCIMECGRDLGMHSALRLADCVLDDMTELNVIGWHWWLAVSPYDFKDGLLYVNEAGTELIASKMYYALGNFSKFIKSGYVRIGCNVSSARKKDKVSARAVAFSGDGKTVLVIKNGSLKCKMQLPSMFEHKKTEVYVTDANHGLECIYSGQYVPSIELSANSLTTVVFE